LICGKKGGYETNPARGHGLARYRLTGPKWQKLFPVHLLFSSAKLLDQQGLRVGFQ
jgi:hypothetical protein